MKKHYILFYFLLFFLKGVSQDGYITFDNPTNLFRIKIDTSNPGNIWQIGKPDKQFFKKAHSLPNDIITDSINPYPVNNNSIFYLGINLPYPNPGWYQETDFSFFYKMDSDTINDYGKIEFSLDTGQTFYNLLRTYSFHVTDSTGNIIANYGNGDTIVFSGKTNGWYQFYSTLILLPSPDTIIFRFTFHSDSNQNDHDGWMIDDIGWFTWWEGIQENFYDFKIFPNPAKDILQIDSKRKIKEVSVITELGQTLLKNSITNMPVILNIRSIDNGLYIMKIVYEGDEMMMKKFLIQK